MGYVKVYDEKYTFVATGEAFITLTSELGSATTFCDDLGPFSSPHTSCKFFIWGQNQGSVEDGDEAIHKVHQPR